MIDLGFRGGRATAGAAPHRKQVGTLSRTVSRGGDACPGHLLEVSRTARASAWRWSPAPFATEAELSLLDLLRRRLEPRRLGSRCIVDGICAGYPLGFSQFVTHSRDRSECGTLLAAAPPAFHPLLLTYLRTGMRCGEAVQLRWKSVDLDRRVLTIEPSTTKSGEARHIPLTDDLFRALTKLRNDTTPPHAPVFARGDSSRWSEGMVRY